MKKLNEVSETIRASFERCDKFLEIIKALKAANTPVVVDFSSIHNECEQIIIDLEENVLFLNGIWNCKTLDEIRARVNKKD